MADKEYIERGALLMTPPFTKFGGDSTWYTEGYLDCAEEARKAVNDAPAADVVEVRHGYWILWKPRRENRNATYKCSVCGKLRSSYYNDVGEWEYCPCGARMDGERKDIP